MYKNYTANVIFSSSFLDYPDPESHSVVAFMMGCNNNCKGCHNYRFKDRIFFSDDIKTYDIHDFCKEVRKRLTANRTNKLVLSGGDPLSSFNIDFTKELLNNKPFCSSCDICIYTGYDIEYVKNNNLPNTFKYIKVGNYIEDVSKKPKKTSEKFVLASSNQGIYDNTYNLLSKDGIFLFKS
jgi:organic radical activating enzyme